MGMCRQKEMSKARLGKIKNYFFDYLQAVGITLTHKDKVGGHKDEVRQ